MAALPKGEAKMAALPEGEARVVAVRDRKPAEKP